MTKAFYFSLIWSLLNLNRKDLEDFFVNYMDKSKSFSNGNKPLIGTLKRSYARNYKIMMC